MSTISVVIDYKERSTRLLANRLDTVKDWVDEIINQILEEQITPKKSRSVMGRNL